eukprot:CAMPEP_0114621434 /NCGR_PEP_ID=MMETSP0168-20121206/9227_1 /TAXON_ID=95228 ORGANISM="Vannella sp., Strain DIVA3 517/6/12" /NCGR_SAMPLE_ID=MMETSP0168 /ASSEMBLY_ACC=CAM_ASM_000044 /LENGTH=554 /DNA_ID=CAMNT_0001832633 /DNA_START=153 /DNA_END=1817 /DNA_ORIENTATION=+
MPITVKVTYSNDTRRITLPRKPTFAELHEVIRRMFKFTEEEIAVRYIDEDEELVRITNDEELEEAFQTLRKTKVAADRQLLRLYVNKAGEADQSTQQLLQLLSSVSGQELQQSVAQLNMLASLMQSTQLSQILPALAGKAQPSPFASPATVAQRAGLGSPVDPFASPAVDIKDWSRSDVLFESSPAADRTSPAPAAPAQAQAQVQQPTGTPAQGATPLSGEHGSGEPYTVTGKQYQFKPSPRVVAEPVNGPGPVAPVPKHAAGQPSAFDSFDSEPVEVHVPPFPNLTAKPQTILQPTSETVVALSADTPESAAPVPEQPQQPAEEAAVEQPVAVAAVEPSGEQPVAEEKPKETAVQTAVEPPIPAVGQSQKVKYQARFVRDLYVVDQEEMKPFQQFVRGWVMCNDGYAEWPAGTKMTWVAGDKLSANLQKDVPVVKPGETVEVSMDMCAPGRPGRYVGYYRLALPNGNRFGHRVWVDIMVKEATPQLSMPSSSHFISQPSAPPTEEVVPPHLQKVYDTLVNMGFSDKPKVIAALKKHEGNIERSIEELLKTMVA